MIWASVATRPKASGFGRGDDGQVGGGISGRHIGHVADEQNLAFQARGGDLGFELLPVGVAALGVTGQYNDGVAKPALLLQKPRRLDHHALALPASEPRGLQDNARFRAYAPAFPQSFGARGGDGGRIELAPSTPRWMTRMRLSGVP